MSESSSVAENRDMEGKIRELMDLEYSREDAIQALQQAKYDTGTALEILAHVRVFY